MSPTRRACVLVATQLVGLLTVLVATVSPASAFDAAVTINTGGGSNAANGLRIVYASGQLQTWRLGTGQFYQPATNPTTTTAGSIYNGVYLAVGSTIVGPQHTAISASAPAGFTLASWDTITASGGSTGTGGTIDSTLSKTLGGLLYQVRLSIAYTYPSDYYTVTYDTVIPSGNASVVKLYHGIDNYLGGSDLGPGFYRAGPTPIIGVYNASAFEGFRFRGGMPWTARWEVFYGCLFKSSTGCTSGPHINNAGDFPNTIDTNVNNDASMGVQWTFGTAAGTYRSINDIAFGDLRPSASAGFGATGIELGQATTATFTVWASADQAAQSGLDLTGTLPSGLSLSNATTTNTCGGTVTDGAGAPLAAGARTVRLTGGSLAANVASCTVAVNIVPSAVGTYAMGPSDLTNLSAQLRNDAVLETLAVTLPNADLAATATTPTVTPGSTGTVTLRATNNGPGTVVDSRITYTAPASVAIIGPLPSGCTLYATTATCIVGSLASGASAPYALAVRVPSDATASTTLTGGTAAVSTNSAIETTPANDVAATTVATGPASADVVLTVTTPTVTPGGTGTVTLTAANNGPSDAAGPTTFTYVVPAGVTVGTLPSGCSGTSTIACALSGRLGAGAAVAVSLPISLASSTAPGTITGGSASVTAATTDPNVANNSVATTSVVAGARSADVALTVSTPAIAPGASGTVVLTAINDGPSSAAGPITFTYTPPAGVTVGALPVGCSGSGTITCTIAGVIAAGGTGTMTIPISLPPGTPAGTLSGGSASVSSASADPSSANNTVNPTAVVTATGSADLSVRVSQPTIVPGATGTVTVTVTNAGPSNAAGTITTVYVPPTNVTVVTASLPAGCSGTTTITCSLTGPIAAGAFTSVAIVVTVGATATPSSTITGGSVAVSSPTSDPVPANNTLASTTLATGPASTDLAVTASTPSLAPGATGTVNIAVTNNGPSYGPGASITYVPPAGVTALSSSLPAGCAVVSGHVSCTIGAIASGTTTTLALPVQVSSAAAASSSLTGGSVAVVASGATDPVPGNNVAAAVVTTLATSADLTMTVSNPLIVPGGTGVVDVSVADFGPSDAAGPITVTYVPPLDTTVVTSVLPSGCTGTTTITCTLAGPIPAATSVPLSITIALGSWTSGTITGGSASVSGPTTDPVSSNNTVAPTTITSSAPSTDLVLSVSTPSLTPGTASTMLFTAYNHGLSDAPGPVTFTFTPAAGVAMGTLPSGCAGTTTVTCTVTGIVAAGGSTSLTLPVTLAASATPGAIAGGTATTSSPTTDPVPTNNTVGATLTATARSADVVVSVSTPSIPPGGAGTVTVTATDNGPSDAVGPTTFTYSPPAGVTVVTASLPGGCTGTATITCTVTGTIASGAQTAVAIPVSVALTATSGTTIAGGSASTTTTTADPASANNSVSSTTVTVAAASANVVLTVSTPTITPGGTGSITLTATNNGPSNAAGPITFTYVPPAGVTVGTLPAGCSGTTTITCTVAGVVAPTATSTITLPIAIGAGAAPSSTITGGSASASSPTADPVPADNTASSTTITTSAAQVDLGVSTSTPTIVPGATGTVNVTATNGGPSNSGAVTVGYTPPNGITVATGSLPAGCSGSAAGPITCTISAGVASGASTVRAIVVRSAPGASAGAVTGGSATVSSAATDPSTANNTASSSVTLSAPQADLSISASNPAIPPGTTGAVVLTAANAGPSDATGVNVTYTPPSGATVVTASLPAGCTGAAAGPITCTVGTIGTGSSASVVIPLVVGAGVTSGTTLSGGSTAVSSATADPASPNNSAASSVLAGSGAADMSISASTPSITPGTSSTVTLTVHNTGPNDAATPHITYMAPAGVDVVAASLPAGCSVVASTVTCNLAQPLANGGTTTVPLVVAIPAAAAAGTDSGGSSGVTSTTSDPATGNNTAPSTVTVGAPQADLAITGVTTPTLLPNGRGDVVVAMSVNGPSNGGAFDLVYQLPAQLAADPTGASWDARCASTATTVTCHVGGPFNPATSLSITIPVMAGASPPSAFTGGTVALANTAVTDPVAANNGPIAANPQRQFASPRPFYVPVNPERFLDTRTGLAHVLSRTTAGEVIRLQVTGAGATNIPSDASAVVLNMTVDNPTADGFVTVWPCGEAMPNASNLNATRGVTAPNLVMAKIGTGGQVCIFTLFPTDVVADVNGWFPASVPFRPVQPERFLDTRTGTGVPQGRTADGTVLELQVTGTGQTNIPADAAAVVLNVTVDRPQADGFVTVWPCGETRPTASNLNATAPQATPNLVVAKIGAGGRVCIFTQHATDVVADVNGWFPADTPYIGVQPERFLDTRTGTGAPPGRTTDGTVIELQITGSGVTNIPSTASAVVLNMTLSAPTANGFVTVWPYGEAMPNASNLNATASFTRPNLVIAKIGAGGKVCIFTQHATDVVADVNGWFPVEPALPF